MKPSNDVIKKFTAGVGLALALTSTVSHALVERALCAGPVDVTIGGTTVPMWGFADGGATAGVCDNTPTVPGPALNMGTDPDLSITLTNTLSVPVSIIITGQKLPTNAGSPTAPRYFNTGSGDIARANRVRSLVHETDPGMQGNYSWLGMKPGSHIYQSATQQQVQVQMGLYGAVIGDAGLGEAYPGLTYNTSVTMFYSEIDPVLHNAVAAGCYGPTSAMDPTCDGVTKPAWMSSTWNYVPQYYLINGQPSDASNIVPAGAINQTTLVRFFNAGLTMRNPEVLGAYMTEVAENGFPLPFSKQQTSLAVQPLMTADVVMSSAVETQVPIYDRRTRNGLTAKLAFTAGGGGTQPVAMADAVTGSEDAASTFDVLINDTPTTATVLLRTSPANGTLSAFTGGSVTYTPNANFNGVDTFTYAISDGVATSADATVTITVAAVNDAPVATADAYAVDAAAMLNVAAPGVLANDVDVDGNALTAVLEGTAPAGLTFNSDGSFSFDPSAGAVSPVSFSYHANDGALDSNSVSVTIDVAPVNPPVAVADLASTDEDVMATIDVLANDTAGTSAINSASINIVTAPGNGSATVAGGMIQYTPNANFNGADSLSYSISDVNGVPAAVPATVSITVNPVNDAPVANGDSYSVPQGGSLSILAADGLLFNDTDIDGDALSVNQADIVITASAGEILVQPSGAFAYNLPPGAVEGNTYSFTYMANDGMATSAPATVTITVTAAPAAPPVAVADALVVDEGFGSASVNVAANDTATAPATINVASVAITGGPAHGTASIGLDGSITYSAANVDFNGVDSINYTINDSNGLLSAPGTLSITVNPINDAPVAGNDTFAIDNVGQAVSIAAPGVLANDSDIDSAVLTVDLASIDTTGTQGTVTFSVNTGGFVYNPGTFIGSTSFTYVALDDMGAPSNVATVTLNVTGSVPQIAPEAQDDTVVYSRGGVPAPQPMQILVRDLNGVDPTIGLLANDVDADSPSFPLDNSTILLRDGNGDGVGNTLRNGSTITVDPANPNILWYTPYSSNPRRRDRFWYRIVDRNGNVSNEAPVSIRFTN